MKKISLTAGIFSGIMFFSGTVFAETLVSEAFDYTNVNFMENFDKGDKYNGQMNGGIGFDESWFFQGAGKCDANNPKLENGQLRNWSQDITLRRDFENPLNVSDTGVIYASVELKAGMTQYTNPEFKKELDIKFYLGDSVYFGVKYDADKNGYVPQLSIGNSTDYGNCIKKLNNETYKLKLKIEINKNGTENIYYKMYNMNYSEPTSWDIVKSSELSNMALNSFKFKIRGYIPTTIDNIKIEACDYEKYTHIKGKGINITDEEIASLDSILAREEFTAVKNFKNEQIQPIYTYFTDMNSLELLDYNYKEKVNAENPGMYGVCEIKNTKEVALNIRTALAIYDKKGKLLGVSVKDTEILPLSYSGAIFTGFDGKNNILPTDTLVGKFAKLFIWENQTPIDNAAILDFKNNDLSQGVMSDIYVSASAGYGDGSEAHPFSSITEALGYIKDVNGEGVYPNISITVHISEGKYKEKLNVTQAHSGRTNIPVKFVGEGNVLVTGGEYISISDFKTVTEKDEIYSRLNASARGNVVSFDLSKLGIEWNGDMECTGHSLSEYSAKNIAYNTNISPRIYVDNELMPIASYPDSGYLEIDEVTQEGTKISGNENIPEALVSTKFYEESLKNKNWDSAPYKKVFGYFQHNWSDLSIGVKAFDNGVIETELPPPYGTKVGARFYVYNLIEELTAPGEWYIENNILYFYPPAECGEVMITTDNSSVLQLNSAKEITFENISVTGSKGFAIESYSSENLVFENCKVFAAGKWGMWLQSSKNCRVSNSEITQCGAGGIFISGGDNINLISAGNILENNTIHAYSKISKCYTPGIRLDGVGAEASGNIIYDADQGAIVFNGNDHIIENNEIYDCLRESDDMGAIYGGRTKIGRGIVIKNNKIHDLAQNEGFYVHGITGIFFDDLLDGETVTGNIFENIQGSGVKINGGRNNTVTDNIFKNVSYTAVELHAFGLYMNMTEEDILEYEGISDGLYKTSPYNKYDRLSELMEDEPLMPKYNVISGNSLLYTPEVKIITASVIDEMDIKAVNTIEPSEKLAYDAEDAGVVAYEDFSLDFYTEGKADYTQNGGTGWSTGVGSNKICTETKYYYDWTSAGHLCNPYFTVTDRGVMFLREDNSLYRRFSEVIDVNKAAEYEISYDVNIQSSAYPSSYDSKFYLGEESFVGIKADENGKIVAQANGLTNGGNVVEVTTPYTVYAKLSVIPFGKSILKVQVVPKGEAKGEIWAVSQEAELTKDIEYIGLKAAGWGATTYYDNIKIERFVEN